MIDSDLALWIDVSDLSERKIRETTEGGSGTFSVVAQCGLLPKHKVAYVLVSTEFGRIRYLGLATGGQQVSALEQRISVGPVTTLRHPADVDVLQGYLPANVRHHFRQPSKRAARIPPATWSHLLDSVLERGIADRMQLKSLSEILKSRTDAGANYLPDVVSLERDAFATAFEVFGGNSARRAYITASAPLPNAPFVKRLLHRDIVSIEDNMIQHDVITFPGLSQLSAPIVGAINLRTPQGALTIYNANRTPIERTLGVDLVYYSHRHHSFVMVQYKRMVGRKTAAYRPKHDPRLAEEIHRMREFQDRMLPTTASYENFRFIENPFFLRLCLSRTSGAESGRMLPGMYLPLDLWELLVASDASRGVRGGAAVSLESTPRYLSNSDFTRMLGSGWIGTTQINTDALTALLTSLIEADHSVVAAAHDPDQRTVDYRRDEWGRFTDSEDEAGI